LSFLALLARGEELMCAHTEETSWSYQMDLSKPRSTLKGRSLRELEVEVGDREWAQLDEGVAVCRGDEYPTRGAPELAINVRVGGILEGTTVVVTGENRVLVDGFRAQLSELGDELVARDEQAARAEREARSRALSDRPRWWQNVWVVTIGGGAIAAVVAGLILYLVLGH
jgi:hypothetical protein